MTKTPLQKIYNIQPLRSNDIITGVSPLSNTKKAEENLPSETYCTNTSNGNTTAITQPVVITASELREPLLESGSVDVYDVDPSSVLTRIQTSY